MAARLAAELGVSGDDLPRGGELGEVARRHLTRSGDSLRVYRTVRKVFRELAPIPVPTPLLQLAKISKLDLYVTTTFDSSIERALDEVRFDGQRQTLAFVYAPNDKQDLPPEFDRLNRPAVFYLMGRLSATPRSFAVTREDVIEFMASLQSKTEDSPGFLFDKMRSRDLLFIGTHFADWLARLFSRNPGAGRLVGTGPTGGAAPVLFVENATGTKRTLSGVSASDFVGELLERWTRLEALDDSNPPEWLSHVASADGMQPGAVVVSCAGADRAEAEEIRGALDRAGVDVILDDDDARLPEKWERKLTHVISESSVFVPVFSSRPPVAGRRLFRPGWIDTVLEARGTERSAQFIMPVVVDGTTPDASSLPRALRSLRWESLAKGKPGADFVERVVRLQRNYRRTSLV